MSIRILTGDCREVLKTLAEASVDSIVCDPPYELTSARPGGRSEATRGAVMGGFMGMKWDGTGVAYDPETWRQCLRVLKPGGHLLAFGGTRTQHRMVCAIEDAGFEIRDCIRSLNGDDVDHYPAWVFGSGFPKSLDVSKAIDKAAGAERAIISEGKAVKRMIPGADQNDSGSWIKDNGREYVPTVTAAATDESKQWEGWGTALKPAWEPICVARKPLAKGMTVAGNVIEHGTGALNIDGCRVDGGERPWRIADGRRDAINAYGDGLGGSRAVEDTTVGRWPANLIHDGSPDVVDQFPQSDGQLIDSSSSGSSRKNQHVYGNMKCGNGREGELSADSENEGSVGFKMKPGARRGDEGSAARFFWCPKTSSTDRHDGLGRVQTTMYMLKDDVPAHVLEEIQRALA